MKQTAFIRYFLTEDTSFSELKHLMMKMSVVASLTRVRVVVDHTLPTPLQRLTKLQMIFGARKLEQPFCYIILMTRICSMTCLSSVHIS